MQTELHKRVNTLGSICIHICECDVWNISTTEGQICRVPRWVTKWIPYHLKAELPHVTVCINTYIHFNSSTPIHQHLGSLTKHTNTETNPSWVFCTTSGGAEIKMLNRFLISRHMKTKHAALVLRTQMVGSVGGVGEHVACVKGGGSGEGLISWCAFIIIWRGVQRWKGIHVV